MPGLLDTQMNPASFGANNLFGASMARQQAERAQVNNDINQEGALQELFQNEQMNPLKVQQERLRNQGLEAGLPGIFAESEGKQLATRQKRETIGSDIEAHVRKNYANMTQTDADALTAQGQQFVQLAEAARNGLSLADMSRLPPHLAQLLSTPEGVEKVYLAGEGMMRGASGVQGKLAEAEAKATAAQELERQRQVGRMELQQARNRVQKALAQAKASNDPKTLEALATSLLTKAISAPDQSSQDQWNDLANLVLSAKNDLIISAGQAPKAGGLTVTPDTGALTTRLAPVAPSVQLPSRDATAGRPERQAAKPEVTAQDQEAASWAMKNPNDPRAKAIMQKLGL